MGAGACHRHCTRPFEGSGEVLAVRVDGEYDYVDHATGHRCCKTLDQSAVHSLPVEQLKREKRRRRGNLLKACEVRERHELAMAVVHAAERMGSKAAKEKRDVLDRSWNGPANRKNLPPLELLLKKTELEVPEALVSLAEDLRDLAAEEPLLLHATVPTRIFGDLHGQFRDLLLWLHHYGFPSAFGPCYVFNGDWVDRGAHQLETVCLVFALRLAFPEKVFLLRGNHEFRSQNVHMGRCGFKASCDRLGHEGSEVFEAFQQAFEQLPVACLVGQKILVLHGGLGDGDWDLSDVQRPLTDDNVAENRHVYNMLWSDPIPEDVEQSFGVHDSPRDGHRRLVLSFGSDVTEAFCARNGLQMVVRSHQEKRGGCGYEVMHNSRLVRVFSARDYEGQGNDGAMLKVRWSHGQKLVVRPQLLRSLTKPRDPLLDAGEVEPPAMADSLFGCVACHGAEGGDSDDDSANEDRTLVVQGASQSASSDESVAAEDWLGRKASAPRQPASNAPPKRA